MRSRFSPRAALPLPLAALFTIVSCGGSDPQQTLEEIASAAATAQLVVVERASGAIPHRYASQMLTQSADAAEQSVASLSDATELPHDTKSRALAVVLQVAAEAKRAAGDTAAPGAAQTLDSLAHDARWLAEHLTAPR